MDLVKRLRSRGCRMTPQREAVLGVLEEKEGKPLTPEDIHTLAAEKHPGLGIATIYRTMDLFCELDIASPVYLMGGQRYYEINSGKHHHHMVCISCGEVELLEACMIDDIVEMVRDGSDFLITSHSMSLFGYCPACLRKGKAEINRGSVAERAKTDRSVNEKHFQP
jgi:Fur family transcriptional regulator, ferric uptake regulator